MGEEEGRLKLWDIGGFCVGANERVRFVFGWVVGGQREEGWDETGGGGKLELV